MVGACFVILKNHCNSYTSTQFIALMGFLQVTKNRVFNFLYTEFSHCVNTSSNSELKKLLAQTSFNLSSSQGW